MRLFNSNLFKFRSIERIVRLILSHLVDVIKVRFIMINVVMEKKMFVDIS